MTGKRSIADPREFLADRLNAGETVQRRAERIGINRRTLEAIEASSAMPRPDVAKKVADFYGVSVTDMWPLEDVAA